MERTEPSLVPEWLKGAGCGGNVHHTLHQDDGSLRPQRSSLLGINSDNESPRYAPPRRLGGTAAGPFSPVYEKNGYSSGRVYPNFSSSSRSGPYRNSYDIGDRTDWDLDKERDRSLNDAKDDRPEARWGSSGSAKFGQEFSARRFNAVGNTYSDRKNENGLGTGIPGSAQKAVFDRNFPTLTAQHAQHEKYSSLGNVSALSPRHHWQHPSRPGDAASPSSETWTSSLAEPVPNGQAHPPPAPPLPSMNGPKMAEALAPRVRTPPQLSAETQKLEELALKQSRQLVPMIPKTTTPNSKPKPKMMAPVTTSKAVTGSQLVSGYRPQGVSRPDTGKLHVLTKPDGGAAGTPAASAVAGARNTGVAAAASNIGPRKQKQLLDRRALPIPPLPANAVQEAAPSVARPKENGVTEDKKLAQNRSDFFNTLRKKAATAGNSSSGKQDGGSPSQKADCTVAATGSEDSKFEHQNGGSALVESAESGDNNVDSGKDKLPTSNGVSNGCYEQQEHSRPDAVRVSEEEEAAFLRSLGWKEEDDVEGGLTEEEINAFYRQHMRSMTSSPLSSKRHMKLNAVLGMRVGGVSPGISSSDSESDGEARNNARLQV